MLNLISILIGIVALALVAVAFFPLLGWANWLILPFAVVGAGIGALSSSNSGRNLNLVVLVIGTLRLILGGGIFRSRAARGREAYEPFLVDGVE